MIELHGLQVLVTVFDFLTAFAYAGLFVAKAWLVPLSAFDGTPLGTKWRQMQRECLTLFTLASVILLFARAAEIADGTSMLADLPRVLLYTHFGRVWSFHLAVLAALWAGHAIWPAQQPFQRWRAMTTVALLMLAYTFSATSHAGDSGDFTPAVFNDWVHLVSTAIWGGSVLASAILVFPTLRGQPSLLALVALRLSNLAAFALAAVLLTGIYNATLLLPISDDLLQTNYGRIFAAKLGVVACVILIGALNRVVISSRLRGYARAAPDTLGRPLLLLTRALAVDAALVLLAITMAAVLMQTETA